jgi:hypothetical protein
VFFLACTIPGKSAGESMSHVTCFCCPIKTVCECSMLQCVLNWQNHPWSGLFLHETESGGGEREVVHCLASGWLLLNAHMRTFIYLCSFVYYKWSDLSIISICSSNAKQLLFHWNLLFGRIYQIIKYFVQIFIFNSLFHWFLPFGIIYRMSDFEPIMNK